MKLFSLLRSSLPLLLLLISACNTTSEQTQLPPVSNEKTMPALGLIFQKSEADKRPACDPSIARQDCEMDTLDPTLFQKSFEQSGLFPVVMLDQLGADYELLISRFDDTERHNLIHAGFTLTWRGLPLKKFEYRIDRSAESDATAVARELVNRFLQDALEQEAFSPGFLAYNLNSEDYEDDLKAPEQVSTFSLSERRVYNDPLEGSMLTYRDPSFGNDKIEVSVYPIPTSNIANTHAILEEETEKLRDNLTDFVTDLNLPPLQMTEDIHLSWNMMDKEFNGYYLDAKIESSGVEPFYAAYFFFVQRDKIVKFTATFPSRFAMEFVKQALPRLSVPAESAFISNLRRL